MTKKYTDIKQSKILAEILPIESADMSYSIIHNVGQEPYHCNVPTFVHAMNGDIPCWSLPALLDIISEPDLVQNSEGTWLIRSWGTSYPWSVGGYSNPVDACYELILKLHEHKLL